MGKETAPRGEEGGKESGGVRVQHGEEMDRGVTHHRAVVLLLQ